MEIKKILHCADLHLGAKNPKLSSEKQRFLLQEHLTILEKLFCRDYDIIMICGDLFHNKNVGRKVINSFFKIVEKSNKPVLYIAGNHDEKFDFIDYPSNFIILNKNVYKTDNINFWGMQEDYENFDFSKLNILMAHGEIYNKNDNDYIDLQKNFSKPFNYIALGHEHSFSCQEFENAKLVYSGALFANGFDECGEKGFVEIDIQNEQIKFNFNVLEQTQFEILQFNISNYKNKNDVISNFSNFILKQNKNFAYRIVFTGYYEENEKLNFLEVRQLMQDFFYFEFVDNSKLKLNFEKFKNEKLSFKAEFIHLVEDANLNEDEKNSILTTGLEALQGDDLSI